MKRIHFDNLGKKNYWILLIILSLIFIFIGLIEPFEFENKKIYKYISSCGFFLQALYFSKLFWYKNTVQWNDKGIVIRIKSFLGKSLRFDEIKATELNGKEMTLKKIDGRKILLDLNEIAESDIQKLNEIMIKNTIANNV
ncbi:hypothetical protein PXC01_18350 [Maribacter sp. M208]|uniref:hypothetical protein n=1 Tax=Maribacter huludaoensis TaxID=3030010 RepID=UPI0023EA8DA5|nr:hypothetical protein [Maribacter huludaoensis]MDF4223564.1 hypothetical protein [Maribacter huludaoensis]